MFASGLTVTARASKHKEAPRSGSSGGLRFLREYHIGVITFAYRDIIRQESKVSQGRTLLAPAPSAQVGTPPLTGWMNSCLFIWLSRREERNLKEVIE